MSRRQAGFTIVETLIVLAVGGLILLIVFLAIPNLQRNSRNNQRYQDVQTILGAVSQYELNNAGNFPAACGDIIGLGQQSCATASDTSPNDYFLRFVASKLTFYTDPGQVKLVPQAPGDPGRFVNDADGVAILNRQKCMSDGHSTPQGAGYSDVVALFGIETANAPVPHCQQL